MSKTRNKPNGRHRDLELSQADLAKLFDKLPPHALEAEAALLGAMILDWQVIGEVIEIVRGEEDFYKPAHAAVYRVIVELYDQNQSLDMVQVHQRLKDLDLLDQVGGIEAVIELAESVPSAASAAYYAQMVAEKALLRQLIETSTKVLYDAYHRSEPVATLLDEAEQAIFRLAERGQSDEASHLKELLQETYERLEAHDGRAVTGVETGFFELDEMLNGMQRGEMIIVAARPSMGKTAFALNIAEHVAATKKQPAAVFSLEMGKQQLAQRLLCSRSGVDSHKLRRNMLSEDDFAQLAITVGELSEAPLLIDDTPGLTLLGLRAKARRMASRYDIKLVMVDYLQLMSASGADSREQEVSMISRGIKALARELNVPVICLSQLNRASESREGHRPRMSDLRESGCLTGDTLVTLAESGQRVRMDQLVGQSGFKVWSLNPDTLKLKACEVTNAFPTGCKPVFRLTTALGRTIRATANHRFFTMDGWKRLDELEPEEHVALPRLLPEPRQPKNTLSQQEAALLGHLIGDGCTLPRHAIQYTTHEYDLAEQVVQLAHTTFGDKIQPRIHREVINGTPRWYQVFLSASQRLTHGVRNPVAQWLDGLGAFGKRSHEKHVPQTLFSQCDTIIGTFLRHLWSTDGCIKAPTPGNRHPSVYYATSSQQLAYDVQALLLRLGVNATLKAVSQGQRGRTQFHVRVTGTGDVTRFIESVQAMGRRKQEALAECRQWIESRTANTNRDVVPKAAWELLVKPAMQRNGISMRQMQHSLDTAFCGTTLYKHNLSRDRTRRVASAVGGDQRLEMLAASEVYWDKISAITPDGEEQVYDLTVPEHANFIANDIVVHNSIEQDADVVMMLHREDYYHRGDENYIETNTAEVIVAKQRNGPTGVVKLHFDGGSTRFNNLAMGAGGGYEM